MLKDDWLADAEICFFGCIWIWQWNDESLFDTQEDRSISVYRCSLARTANTLMPNQWACKTKTTSLAIYKDWKIRSKLSTGFELQTGNHDCRDGAARLEVGLPSFWSNWSFGLDWSCVWGKLNNESHGVFLSFHTAAAADAAARSDSHERSTTPLINNFNLCLNHICCLCLTLRRWRPSSLCQGRWRRRRRPDLCWQSRWPGKEKKNLGGNKRGERLWHSSCDGQTTSSESRKMLQMRKRPILSASDKESVQFDGEAAIAIAAAAAAPHLQPVFIQTALGPIRLQMQSEDDL